MNNMPLDKNFKDEKNEALMKDAETLHHILTEVGKVIVGQQKMTRDLVVGLLTGGHVLLEGLPGLAKTLAVRTLAAVLDAKFQRIQFTPDLLPSDLIGTMIYRPETSEFIPKKGPIFSNIVLADEINRAPAKVQSALLEAMAEKQVTIGETTYPLAEPFLVLATQNPIEQEGTYQLPEAQLDRFMFKVKVGYPTRKEEKEIIERMGDESHTPTTQRVFSTEGILKIRHRLDEVYVDDRIKEYILRLVMGTRKEEILSDAEVSKERLREVRQMIQIGASPRASLFMLKASRAIALLDNRHFVIPDDVKSVAKEIFRHRIILTFEAEARRLNTDDCVDALLEAIWIP